MPLKLKKKEKTLKTKILYHQFCVKRGSFGRKFFTFNITILGGFIFFSFICTPRMVFRFNAKLQ